MSLCHLEISHLRNITHLKLDFSPGLNIVHGANASGKTSLLEAIHVLGLARSFRSRSIDLLVQDTSKTQKFIVFGRILGANGAQVPVGVERSAGKTLVQYNGSPARQTAELARLLPLQVLGPDSHKLLEMGPKFRRRFLDWGVFHVEHGFLDEWRRYQRALRQRNAALKRVDHKNTDIWVPEMAATAQRIDHMRQAYLSTLAPYFQEYVQNLFGNDKFELIYSRGWQESETFENAMLASAQRDLKFRRTHIGPQRADIQILVNKNLAQEYLSRGQQKLLVYALRLSQAAVYTKASSSPCTMLVDDLPAELDKEHRGKVMALLAEMKAQTFVTATDPGMLDTGLWAEQKVFHVEHGNVQEVV